MAGVQSIFNLVLGAVIAIVASGGLIYGGYQLWDGFTSDNPANKKQGAIVLIVTVVSCAVLIAAKSIIWGIISSNISIGA